MLLLLTILMYYERASKTLDVLTGKKSNRRNFVALFLSLANVVQSQTQKQYMQHVLCLKQKFSFRLKFMGLSHKPAIVAKSIKKFSNQISYPRLKPELQL